MPPFCFLDTSLLSWRDNGLKSKQLSHTTPCPEQASGTSYTNPGEINIILSLLHQWDVNSREMPVEYSIGILSPYKAQVKAMQRALSSKHSTGPNTRALSDSFLKHVEVNTVDGFQGNIL